jgi:hypothetical protein
MELMMAWIRDDKAEAVSPDPEQVQKSHRPE